jgi:hypothetical protein
LGPHAGLCVSFVGLVRRPVRSSSEFSGLTTRPIGFHPWCWTEASRLASVGDDRLTAPRPRTKSRTTDGRSTAARSTFQISRTRPSQHRRLKSAVPSPASNRLFCRRFSPCAFAGRVTAWASGATFRRQARAASGWRADDHAPADGTESMRLLRALTLAAEKPRRGFVHRQPLPPHGIERDLEDARERWVVDDHHR